MNRGKERKRREEKGKETREREGDERRGRERERREREGKHPINIQLITQLIHVIYVHVHPKITNSVITLSLTYISPE